MRTLTAGPFDLKLHPSGIVNSFSFEHAIVCMNIAINFITLEVILLTVGGLGWLLLVSVWLLLSQCAWKLPFFIWFMKYWSVCGPVSDLCSVGLCK